MTNKLELLLFSVSNQLWSSGKKPCKVQAGLLLHPEELLKLSVSSQGYFPTHFQTL